METTLQYGPSVWDSLKLYARTEAITKAVTLPTVPSIATGTNMLVRRLTHSAPWAAMAGGVTEWGLESLVFYGLVRHSYRERSDAPSAEVLKDFWLAEMVDFVARPALAGLGQYLVTRHGEEQHPWLTWAGTTAGVLAADALFCTNYLVTRHVLKPLLRRRGPDTSS